MKCSNCEGRGRYYKMGQADNMDFYTVDCEDCGGTGQFPPYNPSKPINVDNLSRGAFHGPGGILNQPSLVIENYEEYDKAEAELKRLEPIKKQLQTKLSKIEDRYYLIETAMKEYDDRESARDE